MYVRIEALGWLRNYCDSGEKASAREFYLCSTRKDLNTVDTLWQRFYSLLITIPFRFGIVVFDETMVFRFRISTTYSFPLKARVFQHDIGYGFAPYTSG